jgi:predicted GNAT family N-acyltransferase
MIPSDFYLQVAHWETDHEILRYVRDKVFIQEQGVPIDEEWDDQDPLCRHVVVRDLKNRPIGTGRLSPDGKIGRMAVLSDWRDRGVGSAILQALMDIAHDAGMDAVWCHAQSSARRFYERFGFKAEGDEFMEAGIPHFTMRLTFGPRVAPDRPPPPPPAPKEPVKIHDREGATMLVLKLIGLARRELVIVTHDLESGFLDQAPVLEELKQLAASGRGARIRILVHDPQAAVNANHRLIPLAQRLTSIFQFRKPGADDESQLVEALILNDRGGFYHRTLGSRFDGDGDTYAPGRHRDLLKAFEEVWERGRPCDELRRLAV